MALTPLMAATARAARAAASSRFWPAFAAVAALAAAPAQALDLRFEPVAEGVYAHVGDTGGRTPDNHALNANLGLVVTPAGAVLIDSGATAAGARLIEAAVARVTDRPVRWVVNTGGQDHRWLGNGHFAARGAELIAHAGAEADMRDRGHGQLQALKSVLGPLADGTVPTLPTRWLQGDDVRLTLGGVVFEFRHRGGAHTPGDTMVWLPAQRVLFSGDVVYVDRLLGVLPVSHTGRWLASFDVIETLAPAVLVPGHGRVTDLATARADTRDYLLALRAHMRREVDDLADPSEAARRFDGSAFGRLRHAAELGPGNASRVFLELERE